MITAKQYLSQSYRLSERINSDMLEVQRLRALATAISSSDLSQDRVQAGSVSDRIGNTIAKIVDLEAEINAEIDQLIDLKREIRDRVDRVDDDTLRLILQKRYLNFEKWEQIAIDLNYDYRYVLKLHGRALREFENRTLKDTWKRGIVAV